MQVGHLRHLHHPLAVDGRIHHRELDNVGMVVIGVVRLQVLGADKELADDHHGHNHAQHAKRIGHGRGQGHRARGQTMMGQGLRGGAEGRSVGGGSTEDAHHIGQGDMGEGDEAHGKHRSEHNHAETPQVERHALLAQ